MPCALKNGHGLLGYSGITVLSGYLTCRGMGLGYRDIYRLRFSGGWRILGNRPLDLSDQSVLLGCRLTRSRAGFRDDNKGVVCCSGVSRGRSRTVG